MMQKDQNGALDFGEMKSMWDEILFWKVSI